MPHDVPFSHGPSAGAFSDADFFRLAFFRGTNTAKPRKIVFYVLEHIDWTHVSTGGRLTIACAAGENAPRQKKQVRN